MDEGRLGGEIWVKLLYGRGGPLFEERNASILTDPVYEVPGNA